MIKSCTYEFPSPFWDDVSDTAKNLIREILVVDPAKRLNAEQILSHPWVYGDKAPRTILGNVTENMRQYNIKRKFKVSLALYHFNTENHIHGHGCSQILEYIKEEVIFNTVFITMCSHSH